MDPTFNKSLLISGIILFLFGLLNGAAIQACKNKRMGLSAHLTGVQNGMLLMLFGFLWPHIDLKPQLLLISLWLAIYSMYSIWVGLLLAAVWGASRSTPIAGAGYSATPLQERIVQILIVSGSVFIIVVTLILLICLL